MKNQQKNNQPVTEARVGDKNEKSQSQGSNFKNDPARAAEAGVKGGRTAQGGR